MPGYLVETYLARSADSEREARTLRARRAAEELRRAGTAVRFDRAIHLPEDEMCFYLFEAPSQLDAARAATLAGLEPFRIVPAVPSQGEETS